MNKLYYSTVDYYLKATARPNLMKMASGDLNFTKVAFDTRRIDQETDFNPRRNLQNYSRSEEFVSDTMAQKLQNFAKLRNVLDQLKQDYGRENEWQDSYARVLLTSVNNGLRTFQKDGDYTEGQPALGSLDYLEELMYVRYRLSAEDLASLGETELRNVILRKDEALIHKDINKECSPNKLIDKRESNKDNIIVKINEPTIYAKPNMTSKGDDAWLDKLLGQVQATSDNKSVERTVTITIRDSILDSDKER